MDLMTQHLRLCDLVPPIAEQVQEETTVNKPWFTYPGEPFKGYRNYELYRTEIMRLRDFISSYQPEENTLFQLIIGAAMEECREVNIPLRDQWQQLFPSHVDLYLEDPDNKVDLVIVAPNKGFGDGVDHQYDPLFLNKTMEQYGWVKINQRHFRSMGGRANAYIFCCPFPTVDRKNKHYIDHMRKIDIEKNCEGVRIQDMVQTPEDREFVVDFYMLLEICFRNVEETGGVVVCFSYAVFHERTMQSRTLHTYAMFSEIMDLFQEDKMETRTLCEWVYREGNYNVFTYKRNIPINYSHGYQDEEFENGLFISNKDGVNKIYIAYWED